MILLQPQDVAGAGNYFGDEPVPRAVSLAAYWNLAVCAFPRGKGTEISLSNIETE
jgi:hypothetical protein